VSFWEKAVAKEKLATGAGAAGVLSFLQAEKLKIITVNKNKTFLIMRML